MTDPSVEDVIKKERSTLPSTGHIYGCKCYACFLWWKQNGVDEETGKHGPFTDREISSGRIGASNSTDEGSTSPGPLMEHEFTFLKQYLKALPDADLREIYLEELNRACMFEGLAESVFLWIAKDPQRSDWAILNEIARRWVSSEP